MIHKFRENSRGLGRTLRDHGTAAEFIVSRAKMSPARMFLIVEGTSDKSFFEAFVGKNVTIMEANGRETALVTCSKSKEVKAISNLTCLVDADFDVVCGALKREPNLAYVACDQTNGDRHRAIDLESTLFQTDEFEDLLRDHLPLDLVRSDEFNGTVKKIREQLRINASIIGSYRAADQKLTGIHRTFTRGEWNWSAFFDADSLKLDQDELRTFFEWGIPSHQRHRLDEFSDTATALYKKFGDGWLLCRGHDLSHMLAEHISSIQSQGQEFREKMVTRENIERALVKKCTKANTLVTYFGKQVSDLQVPRGIRVFVEPSGPHTVGNLSN